MRLSLHCVSARPIPFVDTDPKHPIRDKTCAESEEALEVYCNDCLLRKGTANANPIPILYLLRGG